jgi:hypothetical protein
MTTDTSVSGWLLDPAQREALLRDHPPRYAKVVAHHITLASGDHPVPADTKAAIVGRTDDDQGVEAMVVTIDGSVDRPDGSTFHITWSLGEGRRARESNDVLKQRGWKELDHPIALEVTPGRF